MFTFNNLESSVVRPKNVSESASFSQKLSRKAFQSVLPDISFLERRLNSDVLLTDLCEFESYFTQALSNFSTTLVDNGIALLVLIFKLFRSTNSVDIFLACYDFVRSILSRDVIISNLKSIYSFISETLQVFLLRTVVAESKLVDTLESLQGSFSVVLSSDLATAFRNLVVSLASLKLFDFSTAKKIHTMFGKSQSQSGLDLCDEILSSVVKIFSFADRLIAGESFSDILSAKDPVAAFTSRASELEFYQNLTYNGLPVEGKICRRDFASRLKCLLREGDSLLSVLPQASLARKTVVSHQFRLKTMQSHVLNSMAQRTRPMPFCIAIVGLPGIGKGLLVDYVSHIWSRVKGREFSDTHVYHRQATEEYWSGYEPLSQPIIHYSEPGSLNRNIARCRGDPVMTEFLSVCDNQPYMCNMADLESKGKVYAMPELCVIDCNDPNMNLDVLLNNPAAVKRRIVYVVPQVKEEFKQSGSCRLDVDKSLQSDTPMLDRWHFNVFNMEPTDLKNSFKKDILRKGDIYEFSDCVSQLFYKHVEVQETRMEISKSLNVREYVAESKEIERVLDDMQPVSYWLYFKQFSLPLLSSIFNYFLSLCFAFVLVFVWFFPNNFLYKSASVYLLQDRCKFYLAKGEHYLEVVKSSCGLKSNYRGQSVPTFSTFHYIAFFSSLIIIYKLYKSFTKISCQGNVISSRKERSVEEINSFLFKKELDTNCTVPSVKKKNHTNVDWDNIPRPIISSVTKQMKDERQQCMSRVLKNVRFAVVNGKAKCMETRLLGVTEDIALINKHSLRGSPPWQIDVSLKEGLDINVSSTIVTSSEYCVINDDLCLVRLRGTKFKNVLSLFPDDILNISHFGVESQVAGHGTVSYPHSNFTVNSKDGSYVIHDGVQYDWPQHQEGMCGSPLFVYIQSATLIGAIHVAAAQGTTIGFAQLVSKPQITQALNKLHESTVVLPVNAEGSLRLPKSISGIGDLQDRSPLRFEECPALFVQGGLAGYTVMRPNKSKIVSTPFVHETDHLLGVSPFDENGPKYGPPPMVGGVCPDGQWRAPYNHFVKKTGVVKNSLNPVYLDRTRKVITQHLISGLREAGVRHLSPFTLEVAQNGSPENFYTRSMKTSTSAGWAWPGSKRDHGFVCETSFGVTGFEPSSDVKEQVLEQILSYQEGEDAHPILGAQLKDEPRPFSKIKDRKTRVFCMSPYEATLLNRMYLMPFYTLMVEFGELFHTSIGINMHSVDVDKFIKSLSEFSSEFMEGDYGGYDTSMPIDIGLVANSIVYDVLKEFGYNEDALQIVKGILSDNLYPCVAMQGDLFVAPALQPSGKYATAEDNSLRGLVMIIYYWIHQISHSDWNVEDSDFFNFLRPKIYGDDFVCAVKPKYREYFNNCTYQNFCREVYGLDFTNAQKTMEMKPFLSLDEISFLKRTFVFRSDLGHWVARLEKNSLMKAIVYALPSGSVPIEQQVTEACVSVMREMFFYDDENTYALRRQDFIDTISRLYNRDVMSIEKLFPTFDQVKVSLYLTAESRERQLSDETILYCDHFQSLHAEFSADELQYEGVTLEPDQYSDIGDWLSAEMFDLLPADTSEMESRGDSSTQRV